MTRGVHEARCISLLAALVWWRMSTSYPSLPILVSARGSVRETGERRKKGGRGREGRERVRKEERGREQRDAG